MIRLTLDDAEKADRVATVEYSKEVLNKLLNKSKTIAELLEVDIDIEHL